VQTRALVIVVLPALALAACGGGSKATPAAPTTAAQPETAQTGDPLALPAGVPTTTTGPADAAAAKTIRDWSAALRAGRLKQAVSFWAVPSKIQNGTPVLTLISRDDVRIFNDSLACGAVVTSAGAAGRYTIVTYRLTNRRGGNCGTGTGHSARTAVLVRNGHIAGFYRLPDAGSSGGDTAAGPIV